MRVRTFVIAVLAVAACSPSGGEEEEQGSVVTLPEVECSPEWFASVEARLSAGGGSARDPAPGSDEWIAAVEERLDMANDLGLPDPGTEAWCGLVEQRVQAVEVAPAP